MDWIELEAERLQKARASEEKARDWRLYVSTVISRDAGSLWNALVRQIKADVEKMCTALSTDLCPRAAPVIECGPIADQHNTLEVRSKIQPIVKLQIVYKLLDRVITERTEQCGFSETFEHPQEEFRFEVDSNGRICFAGSDGGVVSVQQLSQHLLTPVFRVVSSV
jgi:hypothetical protein